MAEVERMAAGIPGTSVAWSGASYQERLSSGQAPLLYALSLLVVFRSEEHTSELQSLMRISYAVFCLKKKKQTETNINMNNQTQYQLVNSIIICIKHTTKRQ